MKAKKILGGSIISLITFCVILTLSFSSCECNCDEPEDDFSMDLASTHWEGTLKKDDEQYKISLSFINDTEAKSYMEDYFLEDASMSYVYEVTKNNIRFNSNRRVSLSPIEGVLWIKKWDKNTLVLISDKSNFYNNVEVHLKRVDIRQ